MVCPAFFLLIAFCSSALLAQPAPIAFNQSWWYKLNAKERQDFIFGFFDCGKDPRSPVMVAQYSAFVTTHVSAEPDSVPRLVRLAPHKLPKLIHVVPGLIWEAPHGINDNRLWGDHFNEGRAWVEGYLACSSRPAFSADVDRYLRALLNYYRDIKHDQEHLADVIEPLLPKRSIATP